MFSNFDGSNKVLKIIGFHYFTTISRLYLYWRNYGHQRKWPDVNILQLDYVSSACAEFLQKQLDTSNRIDIKAFADLHNYKGLLSISEEYIKQYFLEVAKSKDFLFLSSEDLVKLICFNECCSI